MLLQHFIIFILMAARYSWYVYFLKPAYISNWDSLKAEFQIKMPFKYYYICYLDWMTK